MKKIKQVTIIIFTIFRLHNKRVFDVTPSQPVFYEFKFPEHVDMVLVKVIAEDDFCAMVAIQNITVSQEIKFSVK